MAGDSSTIDLEMLTQLRSQFHSALRDFASSSASTFRILRTVPPHISHDSSRPVSERTSIKTLFVLDSSYNPPSKAHLEIARSVVSTQISRSDQARVLFLLATENADKKPKPADFEDRLVMMTLMAEELRSSFQRSGAVENDSNLPVIDIGVTKKPFFIDKASSIDDSGVYGDQIQQVHLTGFDTLTRIFDKKYYGEQGLSVLTPFLSRHKVRATFRVEEAGKGDRWGSTAEQKEWVERIRRGEREGEGMQTEWADKIELVDDGGKGSGVSSTLARTACRERKWDDLARYVGSGVRDWIIERGLYRD